MILLLKNLVNLCRVVCLALHIVVFSTAVSDDVAGGARHSLDRPGGVFFRAALKCVFFARARMWYV